MDFDRVFHGSAGESRANDFAFIRKELIPLSEKFGDIKRSVDSALIPNDQGYEELIPELQTTFKQRERNGIGFFVGAGGVASLLPELPIDIPLVVDRNKAVLELAALLNTLIATENSPEAVLAKIKSPEIRERYPIIRDIISTFGDLDCIDVFLQSEAKQYGQFHWTNPQRFPVVQNALRERPPLYIAADISNPDFSATLKDISSRQGQSITFANFTNVHLWLRPTKMDFLREYPIKTDTPIVFSSHKDVAPGGWPKVRMASTVDEYIQETNSHR